MLELVTTEAFAQWFAALDAAGAEDVATALDLVEELGPQRNPPGSRTALLWYEHPSVAHFEFANALAWELEGWGAFLGYAERVLAKLDSPRFVSRLERLRHAEAERALGAVRRIRRLADPRARWSLALTSASLGTGSRPRPEDASAELRTLYFEALEAAGFALSDPVLPAQALYELARRAPGPPFRLLYGVDTERSVALVLLGERLDRHYYGDSVRLAERLWRAFLEGKLSNVERRALR
ncbi:MAG TPA: hypothetical protein VMI54_11005 [Polyangiaceae bacterium]|nr:hypothetical protein [Polyangiaceae bacterium]